MEKIIIINDESFGRGDEALGKRLMGAFLRKIWASPVKPETIILYNSGVKLAAMGSEVLDAMNGLHEAGIDILACGTCIDHFGLKDDLVAARISNMEEIVGFMMKKDRVLTI